MKFVKCRFTDPNLARRFDGGVTQLDVAKARTLARKGVVKIIDASRSVPSPEAKGGDYLSRASFDATRRRTRVAWVQDNSKLGGAELSCRTVVSAGEDLGFDIVGITPTGFHIPPLFGADVIVINNIFEFDVEQRGRLFEAIYEHRVPYVKYDHDYREQKRVTQSRQLFLFSILNVFLSPAHMHTMTAIDEAMHRHSVALPLAIDTALYVEHPDIVRKKDGVLVPCWRKCKGAAKAFIAEHKGYEYTFLGPTDTPIAGARFESMVSPDRMPFVYSGYEYVLHMPDVPWAGERVYFEALLCGCKALVNDNVGHASWGEQEDTQALRDNLDRAPYRFWKLVEKRLRNAG